MDKSVAKELLFVVNDIDVMAAMKLYTDYRISVLNKDLATLTNTIDIYRVQGQIKELNRFYTLQDEVKTHGR